MGRYHESQCPAQRVVDRITMTISTRPLHPTKRKALLAAFRYHRVTIRKDRHTYCRGQRCRVTPWQGINGGWGYAFQCSVEGILPPPVRLSQLIQRESQIAATLLRIRGYTVIAPVSP